jgi:hypothetical protein
LPFFFVLTFDTSRPFRQAAPKVNPLPKKSTCSRGYLGRASFSSLEEAIK